ncbi:LysR family transcriptional regulator [Pseudomonas sp. Q1-7]|uniref:LysR family transcriptional regulator n=1 Tax=Pseudomonas sp. Q1-7 TaxID=3020843 RepID=UPI0022FFCD81|nr:LysR family transcriptional regulator [Pseudomonas sp. Q1-7]
MRHELNRLPVFLTILEEPNVTRAAERLGMTQPALSNALVNGATRSRPRCSFASVMACGRRQGATHGLLELPRPSHAWTNWCLASRV